ncbi:MAG: hypothetical protein Q7T82_02600 [Armatimonadota bacterium]|nr:hypothetical protein [Armatimonadota bacterium]
MERNADSAPTEYAPRLWKTLKRAAGDVYDNLGLVAAASFIWFVTAALPFFLGLALVKSRALAGVWIAGVLLWSILVTGPVTAGVFQLAANIAKRDSPALSDILAGARRLLLPAWKLAAAQMILSAVALTDVVFFYGMFVPSKNFALLIFGAIALYALVFWAMMATYQWPLLVEQRPPTFRLIYRSFLFVADNLFFTTIIFFVIICLTILCIGPGMALLLMGVVAVISTTALRELLRKYGLVEIEPEVVEDHGWHIGDYR